MSTATAPQATSNQPVTLRIGTRTSKLALWQTNYVASLLQRHWPHLTCELIHLVTQGDKRLDRPLPEIGGKGLFTAELEDALRRGEIDLAVHSLKDLPVDDPADLTVGAILSREDTRDVLVAREAWTLATLPEGAVVGTSSLRRQAQLLAARPDLIVRSIRGNVDTRLRKVMEGEYDAAVMAGAGLTRLGLTSHICEWLPVTTMVPAPGQGALAVQCRVHDQNVRDYLAAIHDPEAAITTTAERQLLQRLGGGCSAPIGALATTVDGELSLHARVVAVDGGTVYDVVEHGASADEVATRASAALLAQGAVNALQRTMPQVPVNPSPSPLAGKRVVVTRPRNPEDSESDNRSDEQQDIVHLLRNAGAIPLHIPAIALKPVADRASVDAVIARLADYDWILFTSAAAVDYFWGEAKSPLASMDTIRVAAVGPSTRAALEARGINVDAMPATFLGKEIVPILGDLAGKRVLLPRSRHGSPDLPETLRQAGAQVDEVALYEPVDAPMDEDARMLLMQGVDVVTFASGSAVRAMVAALKADARFSDFWATPVIACIGPSTAAVARELGVRVDVIAAEHTMGGLVDALAAYYAEERPLEAKPGVKE